MKHHMLYGHNYISLLILKKEGFKFLKIIYEDVFWGMEVLFLTDNIIYLDESLYYYRKHREGSIINAKK